LYSFKFLASWHPFHSCVSGGHPCHARHGIDALEFLVFRYLLYCFSSLVNDLFMSIREPLSPSLGPPFPERDCKGTPFFFPSKLFHDFFTSFFCTLRHRNPQTPVNHRIPQKSFLDKKG